MKPGQKLALVFAALSLGAVGTVASEGWVLRGYPDPVRGATLPTACAGVTEGVVLGRTYTEDECLGMTMRAMMKHAQPVLPCVPDTYPPTGAPYLKTMIDTAYNLGPAAFQASSMCRKMKVGDYAGACASILLYDKARMTAGGPLLDCKIRSNNCYGVVVRRREAYAQCMGALP